MDFRRIPFNFTTTDPLKRQEELQRRFGLPSNKGNMFVDFANPGSMSTRSDTGSVSNSPRLQHRVPIFVEGKSEPTKPSMDAQNVDSGQKPHVRVIPIEIEGVDSTSKRHRWPSNSSQPVKERYGATPASVETARCPIQDPVSRSPKPPQVCNIPITIEGSDRVVKPKSPVKTQKVKIQESPECIGVKVNGCSASKVAKVNEQKESCEAKINKTPSPEQVTLDKIQNVEEKLKGYHADVEKFSGTNKEKQYRYLDEMLTRCMLELDEIDTRGLDTIRLARKAAVKKVQASIDLLESKLIKENKQSGNVKEVMDVESSVNHDMKVVNTENILNSEETVLNLDDQDKDKIGTIDELSEQINEKVENISIMETADTVMQSDEIEPVSNSLNKTKVTIENTSTEFIEPVQIAKVETEVDNTASSEMEPVQIAEIEIEADNIAVSEEEPVIEEPLSDPADETTDDMDLDSCNNEGDFKFDNSSVQICEVENCTDSNPNELKEIASPLSDQNLEMEITETSDIPVVTETNYNELC